MEVAPARPWRIREERWNEEYDVPLWFRAAERIGVPAGGVVPGPAEIDPLPDRSAALADASELAAGWFGRRVKPFELDFVLLPVRDDQIRPLRPGRYLVPQRLRDGPRWPRILRELLLPHA
jgi:hypothetical protein